MKRIIQSLGVLAFMLIALAGYSQAPDAFNYQAVLRDASGEIIADESVDMRFSIRTGSENGTVQYQESITLQTNQFGLVNHAVGTGTVISGTVNGVSWGSGDKFLQVELDNGGGFIDLGAQKMQSVPYALFAANPGPQGPEGPQGPAGATGATGPQGPQGATGPQGPAGEDGQDGTGVSIVGSVANSGQLDNNYQGNEGDMFIAQDTGNGWVWDGNSWVNVGQIQGPQGPAGPQGQQGPTGATGPQGSQGPAGPIGPQGATGAMGPQGPAGDDGATGPQGAAGPTGATGPQGPQGEVGATGPQGPQGPAGPTGAQGPQGDDGATGPQGPAGDANINGTTDQLIKFTGATTGGNSNLFSTASIPLRVIAAPNNLGIRIDKNDGSPGWELFSGTDGLNFCESGVGCDRLFLSANGNVGIGAGTPVNKLTVRFAGQGISDESEDGSIRLGTYSDNAFGAYLQTHSNHDLKFATNNSATQAILTTGGNLGVGTENPGSRITAVGPGDAGTTATIRGETNGTGGGTETDAPTGVLGIVNPTNSGSWSAGVRGINNSNQFSGVGVLGYTFGTGSGVVGISASPSGRSLEGVGEFINFGDGSFTGLLSKGGGSFKIDHPLDPENKYLYHSFVESPDMMNIYNGNVATDNDGRAVVTMPDWFEPLNSDFRYQLTAIGSFAQVMIERKIENGQFVIRSSEPNVEISWQVPGIRHDKFANANRIEVEVEKPADEKGRYLHPELYGKSKDLQAPIPSGPVSANPTRLAPTPVIEKEGVKKSTPEK